MREPESIISEELLNPQSVYKIRTACAIIYVDLGFMCYGAV